VGPQPAWAETRDHAGLINARAETAVEKRSFAAAMAGAGGADDPATGRCLVPADGFYEWADTDGHRQPYRLRLPDGNLFAMAGLWTRWSPDRRQSGLAEFDDEAGSERDGGAVETFAIVTTEPNDVARQVHDRMPVVLAPEEEATWLRGDIERARDLCSPYEGAMEVSAVSEAVNAPANDRPSVVGPLGG